MTSLYLLLALALLGVQIERYQWINYNFEYALECYRRQLSDSSIQILLYCLKSDSTFQAITTSH